MSSRYDCSVEEARYAGLAHAQRAISDQQCIVIPTDTVYGVAADAFSPLAVRMLLAAKGRNRTMPPPVLIPRATTMDGLASEINADARALAEKFWPGALTLILHAQPSLDWDLGETKGTVALRMPDDELALEILNRTGPLAVSSANRTGHPAAQNIDTAQEQLADAVEVYLDGGPRPLQAAEPGEDAVSADVTDAASADETEAASAQSADVAAENAEPALPSTIVDCTGNRARIVRQGAISLADLRDVVPSILAFGQEVKVWSPGGTKAEAATVEAAAPEESAETTAETAAVEADAPEEAAETSVEAAAPEEAAETTAETPTSDQVADAASGEPDAPVSDAQAGRE